MTALFASVLATGAPARAEERSVTSQNFKLTWDDSDPAVVPYGSESPPEGATELLAAFESARTFLIDELGYEPPPEEIHELFVGTDQRGYTRPLAGDERSRGSFTVVPARFVKSDLGPDLDAFAVHEYMHALQLGYDTEELAWIEEATAAWVEDVYVDGADPNHRYLRAFVPSWRQSLTSVNTHSEYGAFLFVQHLTETMPEGNDFVRLLWTEMAHEGSVAGAGGRDALDALETLLVERGTSIEDSWGDFLLWRRRLAHFEEGGAYKRELRGSGYRSPLFARRVASESCRLTLEDEFGGGVVPLAGDMAVLKPRRRGPRRTGATLTFAGSPGATGYLVTKARDGAVAETEIPFNNDGHAVMSVRFGRAEVRKLLVIAGNGSTSGAPQPIAHSLRLDGADEVEVTGPTGSSRLGFGLSGSLFGSVTCRGKPAILADVTVRATEVVSGAVQEFTTTTDDEGRWRLSVSPSVNTTYEVSVVDPLLSPATGGVAHRLDVAVLLSMDAQLQGRDRLVVTGMTSPAHPGATVELLYNRPDGNVQRGPEATVADDGSYRIEFTLPADGTWETRVRMTDTADLDHVPGTAGPRLVTVR